jgi:hypothetical protein
MARKRKYGTLGGSLNELKSGQFLGNARMRSSRRKSPWNLLLLLILPLWIILFLEGLKLARFLATALLHGHKAPLEDLIWPASIAPFFAYFPLLIGTLVPAMVLINYAIYLFLPPARRAMDAEDKAFPGTEYAVQQPLLVRITLFTLPVAFLLAVVGDLFI